MSTNIESDIRFKALNGQVNIDEAEGIVECFVAAIGNKDSVGDVVKTGAFTESLKRRKPRVVWGHSWNDPIGKVLEIYEVPPSDPRLPMKMKMAGVGGLYAKVQFNLATEKGREAFASVAFFGHEQEWSIGYKTLNATFDPNMQANLLHEVELYEVSPVLHGANQLTGTLSVKSDEGEKCGMPMGGPNVAVVGRPILPNIPQALRRPMHEAREHEAREYARPQRREREDIFEEGEARPLSDEARIALAMELMSRSDQNLDIIYATENSVVFSRDMGRGNSLTYRLSYHRDERTGEYMFGKPEKMGMHNENSTMPAAVVVPSQMPSMPMMVKPGDGMPTGMSFLSSQPSRSMEKSLLFDDDAVADLIIDAASSSNNASSSKLEHAINLLEQLVGQQKSYEPLTYTVTCEPQQAFYVKSILDPVLDFHRLDAEIDEKGIHVTNGLSEEAIEALDTVVATIDFHLSRQAGGLKK
jgi:HK97 family phage prohead protease